jgi:hypothetical protein
MPAVRFPEDLKPIPDQVKFVPLELRIAKSSTLFQRIVLGFDCDTSSFASGLVVPIPTFPLRELIAPPPPTD